MPKHPLHLILFAGFGLPVVTVFVAAPLGHGLALAPGVGAGLALPAVALAVAGIWRALTWWRAR